MAVTPIATAREAAPVMLRLAVAVTNCLNAEETGAWDILLFSITDGASHGWPELIDRGPGQGRAVNAAWKTALSVGCGATRARPPFALRLRRVYELLPGMGLIPRQNVAFSTYIAGVPRAL